MAHLKKIVITGPESTGKSALSKALAKYFGCVWIPEYARIFLEEHGTKYDYDLLLTMAQKHKAFQKTFLSEANSLVFLDTDLINYKVWSQVVFGRIHPWIKQESKLETDYFYLITAPDIPWKTDPLRENPSNRNEIFELHLAEVEAKKRPFAIVSGIGQSRVENAIRNIKEWYLL